jgi:hypothetical protein
VLCNRATHGASKLAGMHSTAELARWYMYPEHIVTPYLSLHPFLSLAPLISVHRLTQIPNIRTSIADIRPRPHASQRPSNSAKHLVGVTTLRGRNQVGCMIVHRSLYAKVYVCGCMRACVVYLPFLDFGQVDQIEPYGATALHNINPQLPAASSSSSSNRGSSSSSGSNRSINSSISYHQQS